MTESMKRVETLETLGDVELAGYIRAATRLVLQTRTDLGASPIAREMADDAFRELMVLMNRIGALE